MKEEEKKENIIQESWPNVQYGYRTNSYYEGTVVEFYNTQRFNIKNPALVEKMNLYQKKVFMLKDVDEEYGNQLYKKMKNDTEHEGNFSDPVVELIFNLLWAEALKAQLAYEKKLDKLIEEVDARLNKKKD